MLRGAVGTPPARPPHWVRRTAYTVHLWAGLASGLVVFVVGITGALYAFEPEIKQLYTRREARVSPPPGAPPLAVSALVERGQRALEESVGPLAGLDHRWITLAADPDRSAVYSVYRNEPALAHEVYLDPYRADVLAVRGVPFDVVLRLHRSLLLPERIGRLTVGIACLTLVGLLASGLILWFPRRLRDLRHQGALRQRLTVRWRGRFRRVNYDVHRVAGVYALAVIFVLALTGLVWSFEWVDGAVYWLATGGKARQEPLPARSRPPAFAMPAHPAPADRALAAVMRHVPGAWRYEVGFPSDATGAIWACAHPDRGTFYRMECLWFDQYTGQLVRADLYRDKDVGQKVRALNYDIHVGQILGLPGRLLACGASLVTASLPITGFLIWWNRGRAHATVQTERTPVLGIEPLR